jgi:hypothetical protein
MDGLPLNDTQDNKPSNPGGCYLLWLAVTQAAFDDAITGRESHYSRDFLLHDNLFFPMVAANIGYEPDSLRAAISKALSRSRNKL